MTKKEHVSIELKLFEAYLKVANADMSDIKSADSRQSVAADQFRQTASNMILEMDGLTYQDIRQDYMKARGKSDDVAQPKPLLALQVDLSGDGYAPDGGIVYDFASCPSCGWEFEDGDKDWGEPFCCHCGQKLKWFNDAESTKESEDDQI